jgi:CMP-2-keto-3-deoxyoctulosonic acid synthetase
MPLGVDHTMVDSEEVMKVVHNHGGKAQSASAHNRVCSDRVADVAAEIKEELTLCLQGDKPLLPISAVAEAETQTSVWEYLRGAVGIDKLRSYMSYRASIEFLEKRP